MRPVRTPSCDAVYRGDHIDREIGDLPVRRVYAGSDVVGILSFWDLDPEERIAIAEGALIVLHVMGGNQPPVSLDIDDQPRTLEPRK